MDEKSFRREAKTILVQVIQLKMGEPSLHEFAAHTDVVVWVSDPAMGQILYVNPAFETIYGLPCQILYDCPHALLESVHPEGRQRVMEHQSAQGKVHRDIEFRILREPTSRPSTGARSPREPEIRWLRTRAYPIYGDGGEVHLIAGLTEDITDHKQHERSLQASKTQATAVLASLAAHIGVVDLAGTIVAVNPAWEEFAAQNQGIAARCNIGANYLEVCGAATGAEAKDAAQAAAGFQSILDGTANEFSMEYPCHSVTDRRWFLMHVVPLDGEKGGAVISHTNITDRVLAEQALRRSEERSRSILNTTTDAIITIDEHGIIRGINPATVDLFDYTQGQLVGQNVSILMPPPYCDEHDAYITRYLQTRKAHIIGTGREVLARRRDGSIFPADLTVSEVNHLGLFTGMIRDISRRKETEEALRKEHELSERMLETAQIIVLVLDKEGRIVQFNPYMEELTGWQLGEAKGRDWFETFLPEHDRPHLRELFHRALGGQRTQGNINVIVTKDGHEREIEWYDAPLTGTDGGLIGLLCTGQDMTERRMLEREILEIAAEEQRRIGQELHDSTQQQLMGLGLLAQSLSEGLKKLQPDLRQAGLSERVADLCQRARQVCTGLQQTVGEVHRLARGLIPVELDARGLTSALTEIARGINESGQQACTFAAKGSIEVADNVVATHLYRIAQEAVNNAVKHSDCDRIEIRLSEQRGVITPGELQSLFFEPWAIAYRRVHSGGLLYLEGAIHACHDASRCFFPT